MGGIGNALSQVFGLNYQSRRAGVLFQGTFGNHIAQGDYGIDQLQLRQSQVQRQQLEDHVRLEIADAQVSLQQARAAYEAAVQSRILQEQSVQVETQKFDVGLSTNYLVIQYQNFLAQARSTEVASKGAYEKARIALERATGRILDTNQISCLRQWKLYNN